MRDFFTSKDSITNTASVQGYYTTVPGGDPIIISDEDSVTLDCIFADIEKKADKDNVNPGDRINYTVTFKNMSNREMYNVQIVDDISSDVFVIESSINPTPQPGESLLTGVTIGNVSPQREKTLTFTVIVSPNASDDITNRAFADFKFRDDSGEMQTASTHITSVTTTVGHGGDVTIEKTANKNYITSNGEEVQFTLTVKNDSSYTIEDVVVTDVLPEGLTYRENSTIINDSQPIDADPAGGIYFGTMPRNSVYTVKFSANVDLLK